MKKQVKRSGNRTGKGKIYIAGKITGDKNYKEKFKKVEEELTHGGFTCLNPATLPDGFEHAEYLHICFAMLDVCEYVFFLKDWRESPGALQELEHAKRQGLPLLFEVPEAL